MSKAITDRPTGQTLLTKEIKYRAPEVTGTMYGIVIGAQESLTAKRGQGGVPKGAKFAFHVELDIKGEKPKRQPMIDFYLTEEMLDAHIKHCQEMKAARKAISSSKKR